jgi:hypothetical protein
MAVRDSFTAIMSESGKVLGQSPGHVEDSKSVAPQLVVRVQRLCAVDQQPEDAAGQVHGCDQ